MLSIKGFCDNKWMFGFCEYCIKYMILLGGFLIEFFGFLFNIGFIVLMCGCFSVGFVVYIVIIMVVIIFFSIIFVFILSFELKNV